MFSGLKRTHGRLIDYFHAQRPRKRSRIAGQARIDDASTLTVEMLESRLMLTPPLGFENAVVVSGLNTPTSMQPLPDGRVLILLKGGEVEITDPNDPVPESHSYLDLPNVVTANERGLLDIALDPNFATNNFFYLYYVSSATNRIRISRFTHDVDHAHIEDEFVVWEDPDEALGINHYGGGLSFGPDGRLYLTLGDKWDNPTDSQSLTSVAGKVIRVNTDGTIPNDNPFVDGPGGNLDEIWALGLRNPFRSEWDIPTARYFIGDVGGNVQAIAQEEINLGVAGANYGWPNVEGVSGNPAFTNPIYAYEHTDVTPAGGSVTGGFVYRATQFPGEYQEAYFLGDFAKGWIRYLKFDQNGAVVDADPNTLELDAFSFEESAGTVVSLKEGPDGSLYYLNIFPGELRRIRFQSGNQSPVITLATADVTSGPTAPLTVNFSGDATDPEQDPLTYRWIFGDGNEAFGQNVSHTYQQKGVYSAQLVVSDGVNSTLADPIEIVVGIRPSVTIESPIDNSLFIGGDTLTLQGSATDDGPLTESSYSWIVRFIHNAHTHPVIDEFIGSSTTLDIETTGHDFSETTGYEISLTVTDSDGISTTEVVRAFPDKVNVTFATDFPGTIDFVLDGVTREGPFIHDTMKNFQHTIGAPELLYHDGQGYEFAGWSDGNQNLTRQVVVPLQDFTLTALYTATGPSLVTAGLVSRFDAETGVATALGTVVTNWTDQSGLGNHLVGSGDPRLISDGLNGYDTIRFDGVGDKLERTLLLNGVPGGNANRTVLYATKYNGTGWGGLAYGTGSANQVFGLVVDDNGELTVQGWSTDFSSGDAGTGQGWLIQSAILENGQLTHYRDGVLIDSRTQNYNTALSNLVLGAEIDGLPFLDMEVAEALIYDRALTAAEHDQVITYLLSKYFDTPNVNDAPVLAQIGSQSLREGRTASVAISARDIELDGLAFSATNLPAWAVLTDHGDGTATMALNPPLGAEGSYDVTITVTDDRIPPASDFEVVTITINTASGSTPVINGLVLELDAQSAITSGDLVTGWSDQSGLGNDLISGGDPRLITGSLNGHDTIHFDGVGDKLERTSDLNGLPGGNANRTVLYVTKYNSTGYGGFAYGERGANQTFGLIVDGNGELMLQAWGGGNDAPSGDLGTGRGWLLQSAVLDNSQLSHYKDGVLIDSRAHTFNTTLSKLMLGAEIDSNPYLDMEVAEVLIYDRALTVAELDQVTDYLRLKYLDTTSVNDAPVLEQIGNQSLREGRAATVAISANDVEDDGLTFSATNLPLFAVLTDHGDGTATLSLNPPVGAAGSYNVTITVTDDGTPQESDFQVITITVDSASESTPVVSGLVLELDAQNATTSGDLVTGWTDQSGLGNDLTSSGDPRLIAGGLNGHDTIHFDGVGDKLRRTAVLNGLPDGNANRTVLYVTKYNSTGFGGLTYGLQTSNKTFGLIVDGNGELMVQGWGGGNDSASGDAGTAQGWLIQSAVLENGQLSHFKDGVLIDSRSHNYNTLLSELMLGAELDGSPQLDMEVAEVLIYDRALTAAEHDQVIEHLLLKYFNTTAVNIPPVLAAIGNQSVTEDRTLNVALSATDPESNGLMLSATNLPAWAVLTDNGGGTGTLALNPPLGAAGSYDVTITVTDDGTPQESDFEVVTITVNAASESTPVVSGLVLELDAQSVITTGDLVTSWTDQSGSGNDLTSAGDPRLISGGLNGHDTIRFDGVGDKLERTSVLNGLSGGNGNRTVLYVTKYNGTGYGGLSYGTKGTNKVFGLIVDANGDLMVQGWGGGNDFASGDAGTAQGWLIQSAVFENGQLSHYKDGVLIDSRSHSYNTSLGTLMLGAEIDSSPYLDMEVAEVLIYDRALTTAEHDQVISHLVTKYFDTPNVNDAPVLAEIGDLSVAEGQTLNVTLTASDVESDGLTFSATNLPSWAVLTDHGNGTATVLLNPPLGATGSYIDIIFTVIDDGTPQESDFEVITITVT